jgi:hypothetical protein
MKSRGFLALYFVFFSQVMFANGIKIPTNKFSNLSCERSQFLNTFSSLKIVSSGNLIGGVGNSVGDKSVVVGEFTGSKLSSITSCFIFKKGSAFCTTANEKFCPQFLNNITTESFVDLMARAEQKHISYIGKMFGIQFINDIEYIRKQKQPEMLIGYSGAPLAIMFCNCILAKP